MTNVLYFAVIVAVVGVVVWCTLGRTVLRLAWLTTELPVGPDLHLLDNPAALLEGVRLREVVRWRDDLLVGFHGGRGSWTDSDHVPIAADAPIRADGESTDGQIRIVRGARDRRTRRLLRDWARDARTLVAVLSRDGIFALIDVERREAVLGERVQPTR